MKTIIAYLIAVLSTYLIAFLSTRAGRFMPFARLLKRIDAEPLYWMEAIIVTMIGGFASVFLAQAVFGWLSLGFSLGPILIMFLATVLHNDVRITDFRHSSMTMSPMEWSYAIGGTLGLFIGALFFVYDFSWTTVSAIALIPVVLLVYGLITVRLKSFPFWNTIAKFPDEAYDWFTADSCWYIYDPPNGQNVKPDLKEYNGAFYIYVPKLGRRITFYGRFDQIEESERRFVARYAPGLSDENETYGDFPVASVNTKDATAKGSRICRPFGVTVVGWFLVWWNVFYMLGSLQARLFDHELPPVLAVILAVFSVKTLFVILGIAILRRRNWARLAYLVLAPWNLAVNLVLGTFRLGIDNVFDRIPSMIVTALFMIILFHPRTKAWFKGYALPPPMLSAVKPHRSPWVTALCIVGGLVVAIGVLLWTANRFLRIADPSEKNIGPGDGRSQGIIECYFAK